MKLLFKNLILIAFTIMTISFLGCGDDEEEDIPEVMASFSQTVNEDTGMVTFLNTSEEATKYSWNFGDGESSKEINPIKTYATGTYTIKLTASNDSGGSDIFEDEVTILIPLVMTLPLNFDNSNTIYEATFFNGASFEVVDNPDVASTNATASKVGAITNIGAAFEGISFDLGAEIELITEQSISMNFWASAAVNVLIKLEEGTGANIETTASHGGTGWEAITFDFNSADQYSKLTLFVDGPGTTAGTFYIDNIMQAATIDATHPTITLLGDTTISQNQGVAFIDPGATAADNINGDISANIIVGGDPVDINTIGTYVITYDVGDAAGNTAVQETRIVNIVATKTDVTAPVITLKGNATINLKVGNNYIDQGATASDDTDGDISANIVVGGDPVNIKTVGAYVVTFNVSDAAGNAALQATRTVNIVAVNFDATPPVITLLGPATISQNEGVAFIDPGFSALDDIDGVITANVVAGGDVVNTDAVGSYTVTYNVIDASGNPAIEVTRTVEILDATAPEIILTGDPIINQNEGVAFNDPGATANDVIDGDISVDIVVGGDPVDINTVGEYVITYNVSDASGNSATEKTRTLNIVAAGVDATIPVITLLGNITISQNQGVAFNDPGATASDNTDGVITANIVVGGDPVVINTVGEYVITYNVSDAAGNAAIEVTRTVNILDITLPVITLNSSATIDLTVGDTYTEEATASDDTDGNITANIVQGGDVIDADAVGSYTVTYNVTDAAGNAATELTRTVIVSAAAFDDGLLTNGDFEGGNVAWTGNAFSIKENGGNNYNEANVEKAGNAFDVNLSQSADLTEGANYILSFQASTGTGTTRTIIAGAGEDGDDFTSALQTITLTDVLTTYNFEFTAVGVGATNRVFFDLGAEVGVVVIDNVSLVLGGGGSAASNLATNGDFETSDKTGWTEFPTGAATFTVTSAEAEAGSFSGQLVAGRATGMVIKQANMASGTIGTNVSVTVTFDMKGTLTGAGGVVFAEFFSEKAPEGVSKSEIFTDASLPVNSDWTAYSFTTTTDATNVSGGVTLQLKAACGDVDGCSVEAFFDNVRVTVD